MRIEQSRARGPARRWGAGLAVLAGLAAPSTPAPAQAPAPEAEQPGAAAAAQVDVDPLVLCEVLTILTPSAEGARPKAEALARKVGALGPPAIPVVVGLLGGELQDPLLLEGACGERATRFLSKPHHDLLRASLRCFEPRSVVTHLAARVGPESEVDARLFVADLLGDVDDELACALLLEIVRGFEPIHLARSYVSGSLERPLTAQLRRRPASLAELERGARSSEPACLAVLARAVGATRSTRGIELLVGWLGREAELDVVLLRQVAVACEQGELALAETTLSRLRLQLSSPNEAVRGAAAAVLGRLRDRESFGALVGMLSYGEHVLASTAHWSLQRIAGTDLGVEPGAWLAWQEQQEQWWREQAPELLSELRSDDPSAIFEALTELVQHPLRRHEITDALGPLLLHSEAGVARAACTALAQLGSGRATAWLVDALAAADLDTRELVGRALQRLTGLDLPPEQAAWTRALRP